MSDQGTHFKKHFDDLCDEFKIKHLTSTAFHQQTNGKVEKFNAFLVNSLSTITKANQSNWADLIDHCLMVYRTTVSRTLSDTPFFLLYGRDPILPQDLKFNPEINLEEPSGDLMEYKIKLLSHLKEAYSQLIDKKQKVQAEYKAYYDKSHRAVSFNVNDHVMIHNHVPKKGLSLKLLPKWIGPFKIVAKLDSLTYRVESIDKNRMMAVHVQRMRKYKPWLDKES